MKIAIIGHGRMGTLIEKTAKERGHEITAVIDADNTEDLETPEFKASDVAIEFSVPGSAVDNILRCFAAGVPVVSGTTGWTDALPELRDMCQKGAGTLLYASNFSIGVNLFMALNIYLASIMNDFPAYSPSICETHHIHKLDHPSGTAITLAEELIERCRRIDFWMEPEPGRTPGADQLPVRHVRQGEVPGTHTVVWDSPTDSIEITHTSRNRLGFALGAVKAAEWLKGRKGFFTIAQMLSDITNTKNLFF